MLTKHWTDWVDYWAVDFDYVSRKEIIKVPVGTGLGGVASLPGFEPPQGELAMPRFRGTLDGRLHLRERVAELPHPPEPRPGTDHRRPHLSTSRAATPSPSR